MIRRNSSTYLVEKPSRVVTYWQFRFPDAEKISPPLLQLSNVTFGYSEDNIILNDVDIDVGADSRIAVVGQLCFFF